MKKLSTSTSKNRPREGLFLVSCKIHAIAELTKGYRGGETSGNEELAFYGLSSILRELGEEVGDILESCEGGK